MTDTPQSPALPVFLPEKLECHDARDKQDGCVWSPDLNCTAFSYFNEGPGIIPEIVHRYNTAPAKDAEIARLREALDRLATATQSHWISPAEKSYDEIVDALAAARLALAAATASKEGG